MRYLKWPFYIMLLTAYVYLVFLYPQTRTSIETKPAHSSLPVIENSTDRTEDAAEIVFEPVVEHSTAEVVEQEPQETIVQGNEYSTTYSYLLLSGKYPSEEKAEQRKHHLAGQYITSRVIFIDGHFGLLLAETNDLSRARSLKADYIALGLSAYIHQP